MARPAALEAAQGVVTLFERHTAAWDITKSADAVLALWADNVRFTDIIAGWWDEPRATLESMVRQYVGQPGLGSSTHDYFVDTSGGVDSYDVWGLGDATKANPVHEVDVMETENGLLSSMHTVYDIQSLAHITGLSSAKGAEMQTLIRAYADAWSSGDSSLVAGLYVKTATRTDLLQGESNDGLPAILDAAARSFSLNPGAVWQLDLVFGDSPRWVMRGGILGGIFTVRLAEPDTCGMHAAVVVGLNESQKIVTERVYWELDSLLRCMPA